LDNLPGDVTETWERLNLWRSQLRNGASALDEQQNSLEARAAELDARDAALRGQLHDVSRFHEQILARERELAAKVAELQAAADALAEARKACDQREAELAKRDQEMNRREHALAQRWTRLLATTCPHCRQPVNVGNVSAADPT
jgi:chromosome segregation ATPase